MGNATDTSDYAKANTGRIVTVNADAFPGPTFRLLETGIITARFEEAMQWVITLTPPLAQNSGVIPYISTIDGTIAPAGIYTAPVMPAGADSGSQCSLRWGAGGVAFTTRFDYPAHGAIFGLTADTLDLKFSPDPAAGSISAVPQVGAFMVPGVAADPTPLRWLEPQRSLAAFPAAGFTRQWAVKPYARKLKLAVTGAGVGGEFQINWTDTAGISLMIERYTKTDTGEVIVTDIPSMATIAFVANLSATLIDVVLEWQIGLT
jgi:hypothetical protein